MLRIIISFILVIFVVSCANKPPKQNSKIEKPSNGQWILKNPTPELKTNLTDKSQEQWQAIFNKTIESCETAANDSPIRRPSCKASHPIKNCRPSVSFKGAQSDFCSQPIVNLKCDIKSTQRYNDAVFTHVKNCMAESGWDWLSNDDPHIALQRAIESIPELAEWQMNSLEKWQLVVSIDQKLMLLSEYQSMEIRERLLIVVDKVKQEIQEL